MDCDTVFICFEKNSNSNSGPGTRNHKIENVQIAETASVAVQYCTRLSRSLIWAINYLGCAKGIKCKVTKFCLPALCQQISTYT